MPSEDHDDAEARPITAAQIRQRAYDLWERNHRPEGFEMQFWLLAERELRAERARHVRRDGKTDTDPQTISGSADDRPG